ncbi:hypothetical protein PDE_07541 [Penicillium oxalicum 114-2]|uniref:Uncharacterized protein n=1 Tax=Penicillium oxalicum (strain 114-2 / CGMCC 5302) TaxID=933388 RepID=S7ZUZ5_PENO1|nr:hypothetical protein PDE_07541 [Penicillium oxalicum 114-2]
MDKALASNGVNKVAPWQMISPQHRSSIPLSVDPIGSMAVGSDLRGHNSRCAASPPVRYTVRYHTVKTSWSQLNHESGRRKGANGQLDTMDGNCNQLDRTLD